MKKNYSIYLLTLISFGLIVYTSLRAHYIGLTCDEASTYLSHTNRNLWKCFFSESCWSDANNHWLNTFLMQKSIALFGVSELSLRLPNLLGHLLYLMASIFLIKNISKNIWVALGGFCVLNFNPFLLEFFALARGYGLGVGCMMASMTFFFLWIKNQKFSFLFSSFFMATMAILSNFIFLNYIACLVAVFVFYFISKYYNNIFTLERNNESFENISYRQLSIPILTSIFLFIILKTPIQTLRSKGEFVYGTDSLSQSFYELVLDSVMAQGYLHPYTSDTFFYVSLLFLIVACLIGTTSFIKNQKKSNDLFKEHNKLSLLPALTSNSHGENRYPQQQFVMHLSFSKIYFAGVLFLIIMLAALMVQYYFLDIKYLVDRRAIILIPLISLPVYFLLENLYRKSLRSFEIEPPSPLKGELLSNLKPPAPLKGETNLPSDLPSNLSLDHKKNFLKVRGKSEGKSENKSEGKSKNKSEGKFVSPFRGAGGFKFDGSSPFRGAGGFILPILFTIFFFNHFERTSNLKKSIEWDYDAHTKEMIQYLQKHEIETTSLGVFWIFGPASEFYRQQFSLKEKLKLTRLEQDELSTTQNYDHIYILKNQEGILPKEYIIEKRFGESGILYRLNKNSN